MKLGLSYEDLEQMGFVEYQVLHLMFLMKWIMI